MRFSNLIIMPVTALALFSTGAIGAETVILDEIVVRGEKESPFEESLSIREVRESPAKDIGEALKYVEGLASVRKGAIANDIVLRGFQKDNINVLVDGVRLHGACPSRMDAPSFHYDFAQIEQVRIVKGPYDLENPGSLGGLVQAVTEKTKKGFGSDLSLSYGSYNSTNASGTVSYGADRYDAMLGYAFKYSDVPKSGDGKLITDIYSAGSQNRYRPDSINSNAYQINTGWTKFGFNPTANSRTELGYSYQDADHVLYPYLKMDADYDRTHLLNWSYKAERISEMVREVKLQAYWDKVDHLMDDRLRASSNPTAVITRPYSMQTDAETQVVGAKANGTLALGKGSIRSGIDYYNRNWDAVNVRAGFTPLQPYRPQNMVPDVYVNNFGMFVEYEVPLGEKFRFKGGMRGDLTWINAEKVNNVTSTDKGTNFGEAGGNLQLTYSPIPALDIFMGAGRSVRTPDPQELYLDLPAAPPNITWRGNPSLNPTVNHEADLGIKYRGGSFYVNATLFYSDLSDYINLYGPTGTLKSYQNIDATMWGAEFGTQIALPHDLYLKGTLSYTEGENSDANRPLSEIPPLRGVLALRYDVDKWFVEISENMSAHQDRVDGNLGEQPTAGWMTTDIRAGFNFRSLSIFGGVNNLLDKHYYDHLSYQRDPFATGVKVPENGRNFYITVLYRF